MGVGAGPGFPWGIWCPTALPTPLKLNSVEVILKAFSSYWVHLWMWRSSLCHHWGLSENGGHSVVLKVCGTRKLVSCFPLTLVFNITASVSVRLPAFICLYFKCIPWLKYYLASRKRKTKVRDSFKIKEFCSQFCFATVESTLNLSFFLSNNIQTPLCSKYYMLQWILFNFYNKWVSLLKQQLSRV